MSGFKQWPYENGLNLNWSLPFYPVFFTVRHISAVSIYFMFRSDALLPISTKKSLCNYNALLKTICQNHQKSQIYM